MEVLRADPVAWSEHQAAKAEYDKEYRQANKDHRRELSRAWTRKPEVVKKRHEKYVEKRGPLIPRPKIDRKAYKEAYRKSYYESNKAKILARDAERRKNNLESERARGRNHYYKNRERLNRERAEKKRKLFIEKPYLKVVQNMRHRMRDLVRRFASTQACMKLVGCTMEEFKAHLESQFHDGMNWQNYGHNGWHVDHVKPVSLFNLELESERSECFHYTNLQPMWETENISKGNRKIYRVMERALSA